MAMQFRCPCGQKLKTPDQSAGNRGRCPKCGRWLKIPRSASFDVIAEPAKRAPAEAPAAGLHLPARAAARPKGRLVVADGHEGCRRSLAALLREHGYFVLEAQDGATTISMIRTTRPDAAIVDVKLEMDTGFHVLEAIRDPQRTTNKAVWEIPILMTTSELRGREEQYALHLGAFGYFVKPLVAADLCPKLEKAIRAYRR